MNGRSEVISIKESHNSNERIEDIWILDNNTNLTLQRDTEFQIPIPLQNSTDFDYFQTNSFTFGKTTTNIKKDENFDFIYELSSCESGSITEYGKKSSYRVPFEMNIHYINGKSEILKGNFERNVFEKGDVKFIHISNDNCS